MTPLEDVKKFYLFWDNFKSWREFAQYDEYDTEDAQDRYEKRWMEKENAKLRKVHEKAERKRIFTLTNRAYDMDPRIMAEKKMVEQRLAEAKQAKKDAKANKYKVVENN